MAEIDNSIENKLGEIIEIIFLPYSIIAKPSTPDEVVSPLKFNP